ncbi:ABC transporter ATP-binding protein [Bacillus alkalisoli]|uniref:ABC transporter ATP-binding protein n=1 Tax=Bacillus alkalisoli TaxID=2011008 RepID=UPI000C24D009|nr:ABC transporter ATP-binding protein [Bacillus alkalisoli]
MIEVKGISKSYQVGEESICVLNNVSLHIEAGSYASIVGPSGSGKSTLMHIVGGLETFNDREVRIDGEEINKLNDARLSTFRKEKIGFIFQQFQLLSTATALENVMMPLLSFFSSKDVKYRAEEALQKVGLSHRKHHLPSRMSGGEQQRVAIARALVTNPRILLADEPTGNLDSDTGNSIIKLMEEIHDLENVTIMMITHDMSIAERADRVVKILDGRIVS